MPPLDRRNALRELLASAGLDAALVTSHSNVRYLTGFTGSNGAVLVSADGTDLLASDGRYVEQAREEAPDAEFVLDRAVAAGLLGRAARAGLTTVGFEAHEVSVELHGELVGLGPVLRPLGRAVEGLRTTKDDEELALLRTACELTDAALDELRDGVRVGATERELARRLETRFHELGADGAAFETIVAGGPNSAVPHHVPTDRPLEAGDLLKVDCGARYRGYCADTTRTWVVGAPPADWQRELHALVAAAQRAGIAALRPGADVRDVDAAARSVVEAAGHGEHFGHGLGHGVGLDIHEAPLLAATSEGRLSPRVPVTVEPGVYLPGRGGVRIEDVLLVRERPAGTTDEEPLPLTRTERDLLSVG
ncbi:Xaa-Pro aminopeptidase [Motilibacter peucedani]|uniref:Xaa-Pro aminopeptidase n=1 Tax=Motilibacter peucedani TaxID=598650 RepID=A0A420XSB0_9ACTN|nr:Xaa-Pro peptidase family protein [Motilibacter peucedani]RKS77768.1 Xaa-Pro aminopeptidase [Motilibacter peucedani]